MNCQRILSLLVMVLAVGVASSVTVPVRADVDPNFRQTLSDKIDDMRDAFYNFKLSVEDDLSKHITDARADLIKALRLIQAPTPQSSLVKAAIDAAQSDKKMAVDGIADVQSAQTAARKAVEDFITEIETHQYWPGGVQTEEAEILIEKASALIWDLDFKTGWIVTINNYLACANQNLTEAIAFLESSPPNFKEAKGAIRKADRCLTRAKKYEHRIIQNIKYLFRDLARLRKELYRSNPGSSSGGSGAFLPFSRPFVVRAVRASPNPATMHAVRFEALGQGIAEIRAEIFNLAGKKIFDSDFVMGSELGWQLNTNYGDTVANGVYLYIITIKGFNGEVIRSKLQRLMVLR